MEVDFGISNYLGDRKTTIPCVMKELYSDFIVKEVLADQSVLRLATASEVQSYVKNEEEKGVDECISVPSVITAEQISALDGLNKASETLKISCETLSKEDRKALHEFIRLRYQGKLSSETKDNAIEISYCGVNSKIRKRKRWDKDCPDYCHFTLAKENKDTSYAIGVIAKFLHVSANNFRTHGIKDRRAVTCQRVSCNRIEKERIISLNAHLRDIVVYDFNYEHNELKMGGHWGNRFCIILRNIPPESENILDDRLGEFVTQGFINYFGTQRFGSCGTSTAAVGKKILQRDWESAVRLILNNEHIPDYLGSVGDALRCWERTGDASLSLKELKGSQAYASIEAIVFKCLAKGGTWQKCITEALPINLRSLYVHAYQSLLWNKVVSRRISEHGSVVCMDDLGHDGKKLSSDASIFDIHVPLPGENITFEKNYVSSWYEELLSDDGLSFSSFSTLENRFALGERTRPMVVSPKDVKWKFMRYSDPRAYLQDGLSTQAIHESEMKGDLMALQVEFSLPSGCYATIALRQITGIDMGKHSMKMKISVKNKADGSIFQIEVSPTETVGELRSKICSQLNLHDPGALRISFGAEELKVSDLVPIKDVGIVSGDRLFIEGSPPTSSCKPTDSGLSRTVDDESNVNMDECPLKESDENANPAVAFRDIVIRAARDYLEDSHYSNSFLQSWSRNNLSGAELHFEFRNRSETSNIFVVITAFSQPNVSAVVNIGRIVDLSRKLLSSFTVQPASVKDCVIDGVARALSNRGATGVTLIHLLSLRCIREQILTHMDPRTVTRLSEVSHVLRSILMSPSVDRTYWMKRLCSEFGQEMVQKAQEAGVTFRSIYREKYVARKLAQRSGALCEHAYATYLPRSGFIPPLPQPNVPDASRHPRGPLLPVPDPLQPIPNPMNPLIQPPGINPFGPGGAPFGGQGGPFGGSNPLDPFNPNNREIFPSRPNQGVPRGGPRYFPANRWDRNDFI